MSTKIMKNGFSCSQNLIFDRLCNITKSANFCPSKVTNQLCSRFFGTYLPSLDFLTPQGKKVNQGEAPRGGASGKALVNHCNSFLGNAHFNWVFHNTYKLATAIVYPKYQPPIMYLLLRAQELDPWHDSRGYLARIQGILDLARVQQGGPGDPSQESRVALLEPRS